MANIPNTVEYNITGWLLAFLILNIVFSLYWLWVGIVNHLMSLISFIIGKINNVDYNTIPGIVTPSPISDISYLLLYFLLGGLGLYGSYLIIKKRKRAITFTNYFLRINMIVYFIFLIFSILTFDMRIIGIYLLIVIFFIGLRKYLNSSIQVRNTLVK